MESAAEALGDTQSVPAVATDDHETQRLSNLTERDVGVAHGLDKIATSVDQLRQEIQSVRVLLEALVAKL